MGSPSPLQYDFVAGLDLSALTTVTKTQFLSAVNKLEPLNNIGGVIYMNGGGDVAKTQWPGIVNNPRFKRYLWVDTYATPPTLKLYDQSGDDGYDNWDAATVADGGVTTAKLADDAVTVDKILHDATKPRYVLRQNAAGSAVEFAAPSSIMDDNDISLSALNDLAAADKAIVQKTASGPTWSTIGTVSADVLAAITSIALNKLDYAGAPSLGIIQIPSGGGLPAWVQLTLDKIAQTGAATNQVPKWDGSVWTPSSIEAILVKNSGIDSSDISTAAAGLGYFSYGHGLGRIPYITRAVLVCTSAAGDRGYSQYDEVDVAGFSHMPGSDSGWAAFPVVSDSTQVKVILNPTLIGTTGATTVYLVHKGGSDPGGFIDPSKWSARIYYL